MKLIKITSTLLVAFGISLIPTPLMALAKSACDLSYRGVVGSGVTAIALMHDDASDKMIFARVNDAVSPCRFKVIMLRRGKITLSAGSKTFELAAQGLTSTERTVTNGSEHVLSRDQIDHEEDLVLGKLTDLGADLVAAGLMTSEEVNQAISDEQMAYQLEGHTSKN